MDSGGRQGRCLLCSLSAAGALKILVLTWAKHRALSKQSQKDAAKEELDPNHSLSLAQPTSVRSKFSFDN